MVREHVGPWMQLEDVDVSSLTTAELKFDYFSDPGTYVVSPKDNY